LEASAIGWAFSSGGKTNMYKMLMVNLFGQLRSWEYGIKMGIAEIYFENKSYPRNRPWRPIGL
jgi:hypothetical protein